MRTKAILLGFLLSASVTLASGWHDYTVGIGDGYAVWRNNSMDINIANAERRILIGPGERDAIGPLAKYAVNDQYIFAATYGKSPPRLEASSVIVRTQEFFFVLTKQTDEVAGPFL